IAVLDELYSQFSLTIPLLGYILRACTVFCVRRAAADEFERWVASDGLDEAGRARCSDELKSMRANTEWVERVADGVAEWVDTALPAALATSL
ncbi:hypothetical protein HK405_012983, partial [Cladochytrium tenue]